MHIHKVWSLQASALIYIIIKHNTFTQQVSKLSRSAEDIQVLQKTFMRFGEWTSKKENLVLKNIQTFVINDIHFDVSENGANKDKSHFNKLYYSWCWSFSL